MGLISLLLVLLLISPLLGLIFASFILVKKGNDTFVSNVVFIYFGLFLGVLNTLKTPESDLVNYMVFFENASSYNYLDYLLIENKEYFYFTLNYLIYYVSKGDFSLFLVFITSLSYYCLFYSIRMLHNNLNLGKNAYWVALIVVFLFPNFFAISAHLMRQFLGLAIVSVFLMKNIFKGNKASLPFFILAVLTHTSTLVFAVAFIPAVKKKLSPKKIVQFILGTTILIILGGVFASVLSDLPVIGYAFKRFTRRETAIWETDNLGVLSLLIQLIVLTLFYVGIVRNNRFNQTKINMLFNLALLLILFVLANYNNTSMAARFNFYVYMFLPFGMYFLQQLLFIRKIKVKRLLNSVILLFFLVWFIYKLNYGTWEYNNLEKMFLTFL